MVLNSIGFYMIQLRNPSRTLGFRPPFRASRIRIKNVPRHIKVAVLRPIVLAIGASILKSISCGHSPGPANVARQVLRERGVEVHDGNEDYKNRLRNSCHIKVKEIYK
jgi:hypothetical protein